LFVSPFNNLKGMNNSIKEWLSFSKKERLGIIALVVVMTVFLLLPSIFEPKLPPIFVDTVYNFNSSNKKPLSLSSESIIIDSGTVTVKPTMFYFDPNIISENGWVQLGLPQKTIRTILNYRNKGGQFRAATDLKKIWGLLPEDAERLIPYVHIKQFNGKANKIEFKTVQPKKILDINEASVTDWESLPGIGPVLANRIIHYREKLGRFSSIEQIKKTYGITDSVFQLILPNLSLIESVNEPIKKLESGLADINKADESTLLKVGIPESIAKAIVLYRKQYGKYQQMSDLKNIVFINEAVYQQIIPKLTLE